MKRFLVNRILPVLIFMTGIFARAISMRSAERVGALLGILAFYLLKYEREKALLNLKTVFGNDEEAKLRAIAVGCFRHLGISFMEVCRFPSLNAEKVDRLVKTADRTELNKVLDSKKGLIVFTGHIGNWELLAGYFGLHGIPVNVIVRDMPFSRINDIIISYRKRVGVNSIYRGSALRQALRVLKRGDSLGTLMDQDTEAEGLTCNFFGKPAYTPTGAIELGKRLGVKMFFMSIARVAPCRHYLRIEGPFQFSEEVETKTIAEFFNALIEKSIRSHPEQWVWMHNRWRRW